MKKSGQRTPKELIEIYWEEIWNKGRAELIREICTDPLVRYDVSSSVTSLSHEEQIARVRTFYEKLKPRFTHEILVADDRHAVSVWNLYCAADPSFDKCGIEVFRAEGGRLVACWNSPYSSGRWGADGDDSVPAAHPPVAIGHVAGITMEWLQDVLCAALPDAPRINVLFDVMPVGNGTTTGTFRASYGFSKVATQAPSSLIVKLPPLDMEIRQKVSQMGCYEREVKAYQAFADIPFRIPRAYFVDFVDSGAFTVVLEDLTGRGTPGDQIRGCSIEEAQAVVLESALLHRAYWRKPEIDGLDWPLRLAPMSQALAQGYAAGAAKLREMFPADFAELEIVDTATPLIAAWCQRPVRHRTLIHGDMRVDNIFFERNGDKPRACLIDLQNISIGDPHFDLAYFLTGSLEPAARANCERRLVTEHARLMAAVDPGYDADEAWENYRRYAISGLLLTVLSATIIVQSNHNEKLLKTLVRRNCAAVRALDGIDAARRAIAA